MTDRGDEPDAAGTRPRPANDAFEAALSRARSELFVLRLYVAGNGRRSLCAIANTRRLCREHLAGRYDLEVIDIYQQPELATEAGILAVPTLIKHQPLPPQRFVGDMSNTERLLSALQARGDSLGGSDDERAP